MGEKKQYRLQMDFPFYTQRMTQETWKEEGFSSFSEADSWTFRSCGIASLRMILEGLGKQVERHGTMIAKGVAAGAYKEGVGWIHWGLAKLAADYGIYGEALREKTAEDLKRELDAGHPAWFLWHPFFKGASPSRTAAVFTGKAGIWCLCLAMRPRTAD